MLLPKPQPRVKTYTIGLTEEEREEVRKKKKNLSPIRQKYDKVIRDAEIRNFREKIGYPYDRVSDRPRRKRFL